jgi:amino acid adenylation domain-containing protein
VRPDFAWNSFSIFGREDIHARLARPKKRPKDPRGVLCKKGTRVAQPYLAIARKMAARRGGPVTNRRDASVEMVIGAIEEAARGSEAIAIVDGPVVASYRRLDRESSRLAARLRQLGVRRDVVVGVWGERSAEFTMMTLAVWKAGGGYMPLDRALPVERISFMLRTAGARVLVGRGIDADVAAPGCERLDLSAGIPGALDVPREPRQPGDTAYVIYTSGSTGEPKGVAVADASLANLISWHVAAFGVTPADRATCMANVGFDAAVWEVWPYLAAGAEVHVVPHAARSDAYALRTWLVETSASMAFVPTPMAEQLLALSWPDGAALRTLLTGGDVLHGRPPRGLPFEVINNYGPTEATVVATSTRVAPAAGEQGLPPIGLPIANTRVYLLNTGGDVVPDGETGEIWIAGAGVALRYVNRPELSAQRFASDPFVPGDRMYRTGDLGRRRPDGQLLFAGRADDQVKVRGCRVEPAEIVSALNTHPGVSASAVRVWGEGADARLVGYVVPRAQAIGEATLCAHLRATLPEYMVPGVFVTLEALPITTHGKVNRSALPAPPPSLNDSVAAIVAEVLEIPDLDPDDNFFLLGGHSLLAAQVLARIRDRVGVSLTLRSVFDFPTARALATEVSRAAAAEARGVA